MKNVLLILISLLLVNNLVGQEIPVKTEKVFFDFTGDSPTKITIISPAGLMFDSNEEFFTEKSELEIIGTINDQEGIKEIRIDKNKILTSESGYFETKVSLKIGVNYLEFHIVDLLGNSKTTQLEINRRQENSSDISAYFALVIGNASYDVSPLKNPRNDAVQMAKTLSQLGWNVNLQLDLDKKGIRENIRKFGDDVSSVPNSAALFFYAGHGLQYQGKNYLVPIDADIHDNYEIEDECVQADQVLRMLELYKNGLNIMILDACRNNPFSASFRTMESGLAMPVNAPSGSIIAYATAPGKVASDGEGDHGLYTQELLKAMQVPGLTISQIFIRVRKNVLALSNDKQIPWENSSLLGDFYFLK